MAEHDIYLVREKSDGSFAEISGYTHKTTSAQITNAAYDALAATDPGDGSVWQGSYTSNMPMSYSGTGTLTFNTALKVPELLVEGDTTIVHTNTTTSERLSITNDGTGPALFINQIGSQPILDIQDDGYAALFIKDGGDVGIGKNDPGTKLDVNGIVTWTGGNSTNANLAYGWGDHNAAGYATGNQTITLTGDASGAGETSIAVVVADDSHNHTGSSGDFTVGGNLTVNGTTTTINSTTLEVEDLNITVAKGAADAAAADGAGLTVDGGGATLLYRNDAWSFNKNVGIGTDNPGVMLDILSSPSNSSGRDAIIRLGNGRPEESINMLLGGVEFYSKDNSAIAPGVRASMTSHTANSDGSGGNLTFNTSTNVAEGTGSAGDLLPRMTIDKDGNVGIGNANPDSTLSIFRIDQHETDSALEVHRGDASPGHRPTAPILNVFNGQGGKAEVFRVQGDGNVGIGTELPMSKLDIKTTSGDGLTFSYSDAAHSYHRIGVNHANYGDQTKYNFLSFNVWDSSGAVHSDDTTDLNGTANGLTERMRIDGSGNVGIGTDQPLNKLHVRGLTPADGFNGSSTAMLAIESEEMQPGGTDRSRLNFGLLPYGGLDGAQEGNAYIQARTADLLLQPANGKVGIGTSNPRARLSLPTNGGDHTGATNQNTIASSADGVSLGDDANSYGFNLWHDHAGISGGSPGQTVTYLDSVYDNDDSLITFRTKTAGTAVDALTIKGDGNVGIGTSDPEHKLHIAYDSDAPTLSDSNSGGFGIDGAHTMLAMGVHDDQTADPPYYHSWIQARHKSLNSWTTSAYNLALNPKGGNVGIGTNQPAAKLQVESPNSTAYSSSHMPTISNVTGCFRNVYSGGIAKGTHTGLQLNVAGNQDGSIDTTPSNVDNQNVLGYVGIVAEEDMTNAGALVFHSSPGMVDGVGATSRPESMRIDSLGNVGIGTTNPGGKLEVVATGVPAVFQRDLDITTGWTTHLALRNESIEDDISMGLDFQAVDANDELRTAGRISSKILSHEQDSVTSKLCFSSNGSLQEQMVIDSDGRVEIGGEEVLTSPEKYEYSATDTARQDDTHFYVDTDVSGVTIDGMYEVYATIDNTPEDGQRQIDVLYGKVIIGSGGSGGTKKRYVHYVRENPQPRDLYESNGITLNHDITPYLVFSGTAGSDVGAGDSAQLRLSFNSGAEKHATDIGNINWFKMKLRKTI